MTKDQSLWKPMKLERTEPIKLETKEEFLIKPPLLG
jgi:hypothetical protein